MCNLSITDVNIILQVKFYLYFWRKLAQESSTVWSFTLSSY